MTALSSDLLPSGDHVVTKMGVQTLLWRDGGEMSGDHTVTTKLTKRAVDALVAGSERDFAWDIELKGFGVRVTPEGRKTYIVRYRTIGGAKRMLTLATHGVLTTEEAREEARKALARAAMGGDPQGVKAERRAEMT